MSNCDQEEAWAEVPVDGFFCVDFDKSQPPAGDESTSPSPPSSHLCYLRYGWNTTISGAIRPIPPARPNSALLASPISAPLDLSHPELAADTTEDIIVDKFIAELNNAISRRAELHNHLCKRCVNDKHYKDYKDCVVECTHPSVAVLFSGGVDSTVIARLLSDHLRKDLPIDLLNVSFDAEAPDRITARNALQELRSLRPCRRWNLVEVNVTREELIEARRDRIRSLVHPLDTVIDDSIGCSLWFAARGVGTLDGQPYETPARVLLHGLGADEQLAGYSRHRRVFANSGRDALLKELALELDRLSFRNLGRDDRIVSDHSREVRFPFLDEHLVCFLNRLPLEAKCDLREPRGLGEKKLLRLAARKLGLQVTANNEKRAIQFGTRIAKLENRREKGDMKCERLAL